MRRSLKGIIKTNYSILLVNRTGSESGIGSSPATSYTSLYFERETRNNFQW